MGDWLAGIGGAIGWEEQGIALREHQRTHLISVLSGTAQGSATANAIGMAALRDAMERQAAGMVNAAPRPAGIYCLHCGERVPYPIYERGLHECPAEALLRSLAGSWVGRIPEFFLGCADDVADLVSATLHLARPEKPNG